MIILEFKLMGARRQCAALDEEIWTTQFIRNSAPQETAIAKRSPSR
jgi:hypothetical protein